MIANAIAAEVASGAIRRLLARQEYRENMRQVREQERQMAELSDRLWRKLASKVAKRP